MNIGETYNLTLSLEKVVLVEVIEILRNGQYRVAADLPAGYDLPREAEPRMLNDGRVLFTCGSDRITRMQPQPPVR